MLNSILVKVFGSKHDREVKELWPVVGDINAWAEKFSSLTDDQLRAKTDEFRGRLNNGTPLEDLMPEAFAAVKEACRRLTGRTWPVCGIDVTWEMVPYDVQLIGAIVLHQGKITEMATGEGKTLAATMPLYLNALSGKGAHLVTVNDYLARRDSQWMGEIYKFLGLTIGCIQSDMDPEERRLQYGCDITYGTNNEFGFDYLRDNMSLDPSHVVQRGHHYAIVDEVDSVLVDEARTPLIISGPVSHSYHRFDKWKNPVASLVSKQTRLVNTIIGDAEKKLEMEETVREAGLLLLQAQRGMPKNKKLMKIMSDGANKKLVKKVESELMMEKKLSRLDDDLYFAIDEKSHVVDLTEKGQEALSTSDSSMFILPHLEEALSLLDEKEGLSREEKEKEKEKIHAEYFEKKEMLHNISQLLKAYSLFEKDVEYVVSDGRVMIVDEFTGRLMPGRRFSDGLHQALEAKEGVKIERETQTLATITLQNYFRLYDKLAGMTGTAETEASEFFEIYKLDVVCIPTNKPIRRIDYQDVIFRTRREKFNALVEEIIRYHGEGRPVLVGTTSVESSEIIHRLLRAKGLKHEVLNAKYHQKEAEIVVQAGQPGAVTVATNMAGRGTDIKLGPGVVKDRQCLINTPDSKQEVCAAGPALKACLDSVPCGLHIIGTERHESRRIDRQLRGRSGRQGDPGSSRFFLSLEDDLLRLFGMDRISGVMAKLGMEDGVPIEHATITKSIERAQKRVEEKNFDIRKHLLKYDDVMNKQREAVYGLRKNILMDNNQEDILLEFSHDILSWLIGNYAPEEKTAEARDFEALQGDMVHYFAVYPDSADEAKVEGLAKEALLEFFMEKIKAKFKLKDQELGDQWKTSFARAMMLQVIDKNWRDHLYGLDHLKEGIGLRGYAQKDPLIEYKRESFEMFQIMNEKIKEDIVRFMFHVQPAAAREAPVETRAPSELQFSAGGEGDAPKKPKTMKRKQPKVGRNAPCPCGSGKKYKKCCGA